MADIAISYSHRDTVLAHQVREAVVARGLTVWIDESPEKRSEADAINIPPGQKHWEVISSEFAGADVVLVIDTPNWLASPYCQDELRFLEEWGKWVVRVAPGDVHTWTAFVPALLDCRASVRAHTRLVRAAYAQEKRDKDKSGVKDPVASRAERWLNRSRAADARFVLNPDRARHYSVPEKLREFAQRELDRVQEVQRGLRRARLSAVSVLTVLALLAVLAWALAEVNKRSAQRDADKSIALGLAAESRSEENTVRAMDLAARADARHPSVETSEAIAQANARDARMRVMDIDKQPYKGAAWAPGGQTLVAYTNAEIDWLDSETGQLRSRRATPAGIVEGAVVVSSDGHTVAFVTNDQSLWLITESSETQVEQRGSHITAVATGDGTDLWWASSLNGSGEIVRSVFRVGSSEQSVVFNGTAALAFTVDTGRKMVDAVGVDGKVHSLRFDQGALTEISAFDVGPVGLATGQYGAAITRCGDSVYGILYGGTGLQYKFGIDAKQFSDVNGAVLIDDHRGNGKTPPVCQPDGSAVQANFLGSAPPDSVRAVDARPRIPSGAEAYVLAADPGGTRLAVLTWKGKLYRLGRAHINSWPAQNATTLLPLSRDLVIRQDSTVADAATGAVVGQLPSTSVYSSTLSVVSDTAYILTGAGVVAIGADGHVETVLPVDPATITDLRAGADGKHLVVVEKDSVVLFDHTNRQTIRVPVQGLTAQDRVIDADIGQSGDTLVAVTATGRVAAIDPDKPSTPLFAPDTLAAGDRLRIAVSPGTGQILLVGEDGVLHILDQHLNRVAAVFAGQPTVRMTVVGNYALLAFNDSAIVYDVARALIIDRIDGPLDPETTRLDLQRKVMRGLLLNAFELSRLGNLTGMRRMEIPLPGIA